MVYRWVQLIFQRLAPAKVPRGPVRLNVDADAANCKCAPAELDDVSTQTLTEICDDHWSWLAQPRTRTPAVIAEANGLRNCVSQSTSCRFVDRDSRLGLRATSEVDECLAHEQAAFFIGEVARRHPLGDRLGACEPCAARRSALGLGCEREASQPCGRHDARQDRRSRSRSRTTSRAYRRGMGGR